MTNFSQIRDSLYNLIPLSPQAEALLSQPAFLRLDGIQQLGFASRVWPSAKHTRFEHSIGVMHLTERAVTHLRSTSAGSFISDTDANVVIAAALLHDIGHYPFSHAIEELGDPVRSHEDVGTEIIASGEIAAVLDEIWDVDAQRVAAMVNGEPITEKDRILAGLLSGTLDMDKLDYLPRDARACNVPYGGVDTDRLISSLEVIDLPSGEKRIGIGDKGISPLHSLINARQEMFDNVYWHHTNRACMVMLLRAVQEALLAGVITADSLTDHHDASLLAMLQSEEMPTETRCLANSLALRRIHKRGVEISARSEQLYERLGFLWYSPARRREVELRMVEQLRAITGQEIDTTAILIDIPKPEKWRTDVWVQFRQPPVGMERVMHWQEVVGLSDDHFKRYEEHRRLIRLVAEESIVDSVREHWNEIVIPALGGLETNSDA